MAIDAKLSIHRRRFAAGVGYEPRTFFEKAFFNGSIEDHLEELKKQICAEVMVILTTPPCPCRRRFSLAFVQYLCQ